MRYSTTIEEHNLIRPRDEVDDFFIVRYPYASFLVAIIYVWFVKFLGPKLMQNKKPYTLTNIIILYNAVQVLCNGYIIAKVFLITPRMFTDVVSNYCDYRNDESNPTFLESAKLFNFLLLVKIMDLLDTVFMVLKKKYEQISFLHVYHHSLVVVLISLGLSDREGAGLPFFLLNSAIHVIMYSYYLLSAFPSVKPWLAKWKPIITKLQIIQFGFMLFLLVTIWYRECAMSRRTFATTLIAVVSFLFLFVRFYIKAYITKKNKNK